MSKIHQRYDNNFIELIEVMLQFLPEFVQKGTWRDLLQHWLGHFLQKVDALWFSRISEVSSFGTEIDDRRNLFGRGTVLVSKGGNLEAN